MSWRAVARNDIRGAFAARGVWALTAGLLAAFAGIGYAAPRLGGEGFDDYLGLLAAGVAPLLPLVGLLLGYRAVVAARASGTAVLSLSLPNSRAELAVGKFLGRAAVLTGAFAVTAVAAGGYLAVSYAGFAPGRFLLFVLAALFYTVGFLGLAVGLSLGIERSRRVIGAAFGAYVGLAMLWGTLIDVAALLLFRFRAAALAEPPTWVTFAKFVEPGTAFSYLVATELDAGTAPPSVAGVEPFVSSAGALAVLLVWIGLPIALGFLRFRKSEL